MEWIDVEDRLPPDGTGVLVLMHRGADEWDVNIAVYDGDRWIVFGEFPAGAQVTHWVDFPDLPKALSRSAA